MRINLSFTTFVFILYLFFASYSNKFNYLHTFSRKTMLSKCIVAISVLIIQFSIIYALQDQESEKTQYENSLKDFQNMIEGETHDNEELSQLAQNLTENIIKNMKNPFEKKKLRKARNMLIQLRDYVYNAENYCIRNISKLTNSTVTQSTSDETSVNTIFPTTQANSLNLFVSTSTIKTTEGKHCIRWKKFFEKCQYRDFLLIKAKVKTSWDRKIFSEQVEVLISVTKQFRSVHLEDRWYKDEDYSKENVLQILKQHIKFDNHFLKFLDVLYDIVIDFYERWRIYG